MDKSYFNGKLCGCRLGETSWEDDEKWAFSLAQHKTSNTLLKRTAKKEHFFCSDGWKSLEHINLPDRLHFAANHSEYYVIPETGAHIHEWLKDCEDKSMLSFLFLV